MCRLHFRVHKASHFLRRAVIETLDVQCVHVAIVMLQVIDDSIGNTLVAASTLTPEIREKLNGGGAGNKVRMHFINRVCPEADNACEDGRCTAGNVYNEHGLDAINT